MEAVFVRSRFMISLKCSFSNLTLYGCTDNALYRRMAHEVVDPWLDEASPKKSKLSLIRRLGDYDRWLKHE